MKKINITKEKVGGAVKATGRFAIYGLSCLALILPHVENSIDAVKRCIVKANYSDTIKVIVNSNMLDSYKKEVINMVEKDKDEEYYKAIVEVVNSNMLGSYTVEAIKKICEK